MESQLDLQASHDVRHWRWGSGHFAALLFAAFFALLFASSRSAADERPLEEQVIEVLIQREADFSFQIQANSNNAAAYNSRARVRLELGNYTDAIVDLNRTIELDPKNALAYHRRCGTYEDLQQSQRAIEDCSKAIELDPFYQNAYKTRGLLRLEAGDKEGALSDLQTALWLDPLDPKAYTNLAYYHIQDRDYESAEHVCKLAAERLNLPELGSIFPSFGPPPVVTTEDLSVSIPIASQLETLHTNCSIAARRLGDYRNAYRRANDAISANPSDARGFRQRALASQNLGDLHQALEDYDRAFELDPFDDGLVYDRGKLKVEMDDLRGAEEDFQAAARLDPEYRNAHWWLGSVRSRQGKYDEALGPLKRALELTPEDSKLLLETAFTALEADDKEQAQMYFEQILQLNPLHEEARAQLAALQGHLTDEQEVNSEVDLAEPGSPQAAVQAEDDTDKNRTDKPGADAARKAAALCSKARAVSRSGNYALVQQIAAAAIAISPANACGHLARIRGYVSVRNYRDALGALTDLSKRFPAAAARSYFVQGVLRTALQDIDGAGRDFSAAVEKDESLAHYFEKPLKCGFAISGHLVLPQGSACNFLEGMGDLMGQIWRNAAAAERMVGGTD